MYDTHRIPCCVIAYFNRFLFLFLACCIGFVCDTSCIFPRCVCVLYRYSTPPGRTHVCVCTRLVRTALITPPWAAGAPPAPRGAGTSAWYQYLGGPLSCNVDGQGREALSTITQTWHRGLDLIDMACIRGLLLSAPSYNCLISHSGGAITQDASL